MSEAKYGSFLLPTFSCTVCLSDLIHSLQLSLSLNDSDHLTSKTVTRLSDDNYIGLSHVFGMAGQDVRNTILILWRLVGNEGLSDLACQS